MGSTEYVFYNTMEECQEMCDAEIETIVETIPPIVEIEDELPEDDFNPTCLDVGGEDFGLCMMFMGYGVVNGTCQGVGGCGSEGYAFFDKVEDCVAVCKLLEPKFGDEDITIDVSTHSTSSVNETDAAKADGVDNADA